MMFPRGFQHFSSWVDELDSVVGGRVVGSGDHDTDGFAEEFFGTEDGEEGGSVESAGEEDRSAGGGGGEGSQRERERGRKGREERRGRLRAGC